MYRVPPHTHTVLLVVLTIVVVYVIRQYIRKARLRELHSLQYKFTPTTTTQWRNSSIAGSQSSSSTNPTMVSSNDDDDGGDDDFESSFPFEIIRSADHSTTNKLFLRPIVINSVELHRKLYFGPNGVDEQTLLSIRACMNLSSSNMVNLVKFVGFYIPAAAADPNNNFLHSTRHNDQIDADSMLYNDFHVYMLAPSLLSRSFQPERQRALWSITTNRNGICNRL